MSIPTITLTYKDEKFSEQQIQLLRETCESVGFFYLRVQQDDDLLLLLPRVFAQSRAFFYLPVDIKKKCTDTVLNRGYTGMEEETLDPTQQQKGDTKEGYYIGEEVSEENRWFNPAKLSGPNVWPSMEQYSLDDDTSSVFDGNEWRCCMMEYHSKMKQIGFQLVQLVAMAVGLQHDFFDEYFCENPIAVLRLLHYSKETSDTANGVYACGAHSDYGMITILATDQNPGLQIRRNGVWVDVPPPELGTFVVNLGDMLERWTNGKFQSTLHRVVTTSPDSDRYSIPFFYEPQFDTIVKCLESCIDEGEAARYPPTTSGQHLLDKYKGTHADFKAYAA